MKLKPLRRDQQDWTLIAATLTLILLLCQCGIVEAAGCESDPKAAWICDTSLPTSYEGLCPGGCYIHTPRQTARFYEAVEKAKLLDRTQRKLDLAKDLLDEGIAETAAMAWALRAEQDNSAALVQRLEAAYSVPDVALWTAAGFGTGVVALAAFILWGL